MAVEQWPEDAEDSAERRLALLAVAPAKRAFAVAYAKGITNVSKAAHELDISRTSFYKWSRDPAVRAYVAAVAGVTAEEAKGLLAGQVADAIETIHWAMRAAELALALVGISKEAALPKHAPPAVDPVVNVTLHVPVNPRTAAIQAERRRLRELAALEGEYRETPPA